MSQKISKEIEELFLKAPVNPFISSLQNFYMTRGFLSDKQLSRLRDVVANRNKVRPFDGMDHDDVVEFTGEYGGVDWDVWK
jgi:hypothetical protein